MKRYDINILDEDLAAARTAAKEEPELLPTRRCPLAFAAARVTGKEVIVGLLYMIVGGKEVPLPDRVRRALWTWDTEGRMEPLSFWFVA